MEQKNDFYFVSSFQVAEIERCLDADRGQEQEVVARQVRDVDIVWGKQQDKECPGKYGGASLFQAENEKFSEQCLGARHLSKIGVI